MPGSDNAGPTTVAVAADAQFTLARVLKPFAGFEAVYQGQGGGIPIVMPGTKDPRAGQDGIASNLEAGLKCSIGARVMLWVPVAVVFSGGQPFVIDYTYVLHWRLRSVVDFRLSPQRPPFHFPSGTGVPDTTPGTGGARVVIPAANDTIIYEQPEPPAGGNPGTGVMRVLRQAYQIGDGGGMVAPLLPDGSQGALQQGVLDPATASITVANGPIFQPIWCDAMGDELIVSVTRTDPAANWDFTAAATDLAFSNIYGTGNGAHANIADLGIYVFQGSAP